MLTPYKYERQCKQKQAQDQEKKRKALYTIRFILTQESEEGIPSDAQVSDRFGLVARTSRMKSNAIPISHTDKR